MNTHILYLEAAKLLKQYDADVQYKLIQHNKKVGSEAIFSNIMPTHRQFRCDFYCPNLKLIVEINGGSWKHGRHNRAKGYSDDLRKSNIAQLNNFTYLQYTYDQLRDGLLIEDLLILLNR